MPSHARLPKRARFVDARKIDTQPQDAALKDGELDLQAFLNARAFEIEALESSMQKSNAVKAKRAFQLVPREMRRRTASHNAKRVPKRLRFQAKREMALDNTPNVSQKRSPRTLKARLRAETARRLGFLIKRKKAQRMREAKEKEGSMDVSQPVPIVTRAPRSKIRRNELNNPPIIKSKFKKRQRNKTWLPTHIWHAKRATMTEPSKSKWGFALPLTPTQKSYRPTHRAIFQDGAVAWDMSYMSTIGVYGGEKAIVAIIREICLFGDEEWERKGQFYTKGCQPTFSWIHRDQDKGKAIAPVVIIFNPLSPLSRPGSRRPRAGFERRREVFIRVHPSAFRETWDLLKGFTKTRSGLYIEDLRYEIGSIEIMGSKATEALRATLHPFWTLKRDREPDVDVYRDIDYALGPENHPGLPMFGFQIIDPRLRCPQKKLEDKLAPEGIIERNRNMLAWTRTDPGVPYALFEREARQQALDHIPKQKAINRRRKDTLPGKYPELTPSDPPIPVILFLQRDPSRWVLMAPFRIIEHIWPCLMRCPLSCGGNVRLGGLHEQQQAAFEQGIGWFPADFPSTTAGCIWEMEERARNVFLWSRRPKSKRVEWKSVNLGLDRKGELGNGMACDWEFLFNISLPGITTKDPAKKTVAEGTDSNQGASKFPTMLSRCTKVEWENFLKDFRLGKEINMSPYAVYNVRLTFMGNGRVGRCARIYRLPSSPMEDVHQLNEGTAHTTAARKLPANLRQQWLTRTPAGKKVAEKAQAMLSKKQKKRKGNPTPEDHERQTAEALFATAPSDTFPPIKESQMAANGYPFVPDEEDLIGFVTTAAFNLRMGKPSAIATISAAKVKEDIKKAKKLQEIATCIVRNTGEGVGWLARWEVI